MRRRIAFLFVAVFLLVVGAYAAVWEIARNRLNAGFDAWVSALQQDGWTVRSAARHSGWLPTAASLSVDDLVVTGGQPLLPQGLTWRIDQIVMRIDFLHPWALDIQVIGSQHVRVADQDEYRFTTDDTHIVVPWTFGGEPRSADLRINNLRVTNAGAKDHGGDLTIGDLQGHASIAPGTRRETSTIALSVTANTIGLPQGKRWPLGPNISSVAVEGSLDRPLPRPAPPQAFLTAWRDGGGSLDVENFNIIWGQLNLSGSATLALDDDLQPMGAGSGRVTGYDATLDALAANGTLTRSAVIAAKAMLSLLADAPAAGDTAAQVEVPLTLQHRTLSMRQVPLLRFRELDWTSH